MLSQAAKHLEKILNIFMNIFVRKERGILCLLLNSRTKIMPTFTSKIRSTLRSWFKNPLLRFMLHHGYHSSLSPNYLSMKKWLIVGQNLIVHYLLFPCWENNLSEYNHDFPLLSLLMGLCA
jgi:hypothetical protein